MVGRADIFRVMQAGSREINLPVSTAAAHRPSADRLLLVPASSGRTSLLLRLPVPATHVAVRRPEEHTGSVVKRTIERKIPKNKAKIQGDTTP